MGISQEHTYVSLISGSGETTQVLDVLKRRMRPVEDDDDGQEQTTQGIHPPDFRVKANYSHSLVNVVVK